MFCGRNITRLCRICLSTSPKLIALDETAWNSPKNIHEILEIVTFQKIVLKIKKLPHKICQICLSLLKLTYEFQLQFIKSQKTLENKLHLKPVEDSENVNVSYMESLKVENTVREEQFAAPVELIYAGNKFDLNDVLVVEEEAPAKSSFDGFLKNLGSEVSATFASSRTIKNPRIEEPPSEITVEIVLPQGHDSLPSDFSTEEESAQAAPRDIPIENLQVVKLPQQHKIIIEQIIDNKRKPIKTLYQCPACLKIVRNENTLEEHMRECPKIKPRFVCDKCGHKAQNRASLRRHCLSMHEERKYTCHICDKKFIEKYLLKEHLKLHLNLRPFLCTVCGKKFNWWTSLKYHMKLHTGEKKYLCNYCDKRFRMPNTLKRHIRTHTNDKPYQCAYCSRRFSSRGEQQNHQRQHTGERPYKCEYCNKGYITLERLKYHYLSHDGDHDCYLCDKSFIEVRFLKNHLKRFHDVAEEEM